MLWCRDTLVCVAVKSSRRSNPEGPSSCLYFQLDSRDSNEMIQVRKLWDVDVWKDVDGSQRMNPIL